MRMPTAGNVFIKANAKDLPPPAQCNDRVQFLATAAAAQRSDQATAESARNAQVLVSKAEQALREGGMATTSVDLTMQALRPRLASDLADGSPIKVRTQEKAIER